MDVLTERYCSQIEGLKCKMEEKEREASAREVNQPSVLFLTRSHRAGGCLIVN